MNPQQIISDLQSAGAKISVDGDKIKLKAAKGTLSPVVIETIKKHKAEIISILQLQKQSTRAKGYGCAGCQNRIYEAVQAWEISELPESSSWTHEHSSVVHWRCEGCDAVFEIIGGSRGLQKIN